MKKIYNKLYFAYGSNLNKAQMATRCPQSKPVGAAYLPGYKLAFMEGVATIIPAEGFKVAGGLWQIEKKDLRALDFYEGYPRLYDRDIFEVENKSGEKIECFSYYMTEDHLNESQPSNSYLESIIEGYNDFGLKLKYLKEVFDNEIKVIK